MKIITQQFNHPTHDVRRNVAQLSVELMRQQNYDASIRAYGAQGINYVVT